MKEDPGFLLAIKLELFVYIVLDSSQINIEIHCQSFAPYNISYFIRSNYILNWILFTSRAVSFMLINVRFDIPRKICCVMSIVHIAYCCRICILEKITVLLSSSKLMLISGEISLWLWIRQHLHHYHRTAKNFDDEHNKTWVRKICSGITSKQWTHFSFSTGFLQSDKSGFSKTVEKDF